MTANTKLCIDCKHYGKSNQNSTPSWEEGPPACNHPLTMYSSEPWTPAARRKRGQSCGPTGKLFEPKHRENK